MALVYPITRYDDPMTGDTVFQWAGGEVRISTFEAVSVDARVWGWHVRRRIREAQQRQMR